jgi:Flp pilus assembly protein TadD
LGFVLIVVGFAIYRNTLPAPFIFDDEHAIVVNEQIRHLSTSLSPTEQGSPLAGRPLVSLTFAINYALGGLNVRGYRFVNIAIHVLCAVLLFAVVGRAFMARESAATNLAFATALIWMVHPLLTEAVNYVSQRTELMMAAFFLLTLYSEQHAAGSTRTGPTVSSESRGWLVLSVVCCALGMACKETMVVAPFVVFLYDRTFVFGSFRDALRRRWPYYAGLCATWLVLAAMIWSSPRGDSAGFAGASVSPWTYLLNQSVMIVRYLRLAIWPRGLVLDYGEPLPLTLSGVAPYAVAVIALLAATIIALVRRPAIGFAGAWFFLTLAPTSSIMPISTEVGAERRMYLPLMAIVALAVTIVARALRARESAARSAPRKGAPHAVHDLAPYSGVLFVLTASILGAATIQRNAEYLSGLTLWQSVLDRWPQHARAHRNLAAELKLAGRPDEEIVHLRAAVKDLPEIRNLLGLELLSLGRNAEAARELQQYVHEHPRNADALSNLGIALAALGHADDAARAFERAVAVDPGNALSQRNLALHLFQQNDFDGAVRSAREAVRLTPNDPSAHNLLGLALIGQQKIGEAIAEFRTSLALQPDNNDAAGYLERTLKAMRR